MAPMDVGWTDIGRWIGPARRLGAAGIDGSVVEAGRAVDATTDDDVVVDRDDRVLSARAVGDGSMTAGAAGRAPARGARRPPVVQALLDRCAAAEVRA